MTDRRTGDAGLSLVEVLVSLAIFAIIGIAGLAILNTVARTGERTEGRLERLAEIDRAFLVIRRDLAQITPDAVTLDDGTLAFRRARADGTVAMAFRVQDAVLTRQIDTAVSGAIDQQLLTGTATAQWRLMDASRDWHSVWPPSDDAAVGRPMAAELTLEVWRAGASAPEVVTRLITLPAAQGR
jgi:general secretion pathway protein J